MTGLPPPDATLMLPSRAALGYLRTWWRRRKCGERLHQTLEPLFVSIANDRSAKPAKARKDPR